MWKGCERRMRHYIIVKYNGLVTDRDRMEREIRSLFAAAADIPGIHSVSVRPAVLRSEKRHDLMILLTMEPDALSAFDRSPVHSRWKKEFGPFVESKTIFDCD